ncbi:IclR family transcriptional regulator [SAR92 clade bacterium H921]|nr:IclR family transcriptional regulator [SAR92 clade bacterium H921]
MRQAMITASREKGSSITRVMEIIEAVAKADRPMSPADLSFELDIPKPSIHRLLNQLEGNGYIQTSLRGLIMPGNRLHSMALGILYSSKFKAVRQAILTKLTDEIGETCGIAIPNGTEMIYYDRVQTDWPLQLHLQVGSHTPTWCTASGKLYLSSLTKDRRLTIINKLPLSQYTRNTITDPQILESELVAIKSSKVGTDNEEFAEGMVACAVPVLDDRGKLLACLFTHAPVIRKTLPELLNYLPMLSSAAEQLGRLVDFPDNSTTS